MGTLVGRMIQGPLESRI